uniref:Uncharacterized protein n=1 Tax=Vitis vinifera TaxID=29760 RepID=A5AV99_VITVI|nr:hypothetical protein VITISV_005850 [Vitis vinifera]
MVVAVEGIPDIMVIMVIIPQILIKGKLHCTTKSGIILRQNKENGKRLQDKPLKNHENNCYKCSMKGHWSYTYRTLKHLVDLYQTSIKEKGKEIEMNFTNGDGLDLTYYDIDFFGVAVAMAPFNSGFDPRQRRHLIRAQLVSQLIRVQLVLLD